LGIIGGGQLGKMMIQASSKWSVKTVVLDPSPACPAAPLCDELIVAGFRDAQGLEAVASKTEVLTCEFEHISTEGLKQLEEKGYTVYPTSEALKIIQNKYEQKMTLKRHGLPVGPFVLVPDQEQLDVVGKTFGYPFMLKTATEAYDGKGNHRVDDPEQGKVAYDFLAQRSNVIYAEAFIDFEKEISILCCRGKNGDTVTYPVSENIHVDSILFETLAPARIKEEQALQARNIAIEISHLFGTVGICCVEIFLDAEGALLINEVAPRPHNSGHYTIEACVTSQFENHVRAVLGLPLGSTRQLSPAIMRNLLGEPEHMGRPVVEGVQQAFAIEGFNLHLYGKEETRPQRKMGHFTVLAPTTDEAKEKADLAHSLLKIITDTSPRKEG
jgi:5-(carboxyamino)imidazole ribonucleotide synthase